MYNTIWSSENEKPLEPSVCGCLHCSKQLMVVAVDPDVHDGECFL
jgi:hypothetical protein